MAITPKALLGSTSTKQYSANKEFTDRKYFRDIFFQNLEEIKKEKQNNNMQYHVLNFYGIGGIGKSSLLKELSKEIDDCDDILYAQADFANLSNRDVPTLLLELTKIFEKKGMVFYHFGLAYAIYFEKTHKDLILSPNVRNIVNENIGFIADILGTIEGLGILGVIPDTINKIYTALYNKKNLDLQVKEDLKKMEYMSIPQCEQLLLAFFAYDLNKYLIKKGKIIVIFLDTYEALWGQLKNELTKFSQDQFVRDLIAQLPGILFVISGREYLEWEIRDPDWKMYLKQYQVERLEDEDANLFLLNCGIVEEDVRQKILKLSLGHPYHLDILVDTYFEIKNKNIIPNVNLFANNAHEILSCFFKYLQAEEIAVIKIISIPRCYNFDLFKYLLLNFPTGYPITMFEEFNKFSFVTQMDNETYHIHEIMRRDLIEIIPQKLFQQISKSLSGYYYTRFEQCLIYTERKLVLQECIYHLKFHTRQEEYINYILKNFIEYFVELQYRGESKYLYSILSDVFSNIAYSDCITLYEIYTDMIMLNGDFKEAVGSIDSFLKNYTIEQISQNEEILQLYVKKIKHQMVYLSLTSTLEAIKSLKPFVEGSRYWHQYIELLYTEGNMLFERGNFELCKTCFDNVLSLSSKYNLADMKCRTLRKLSDYYLAKDDVYNAREFCRLGLEIAKEKNFDRYGNYLECTQAEIYRKLKLFEQSKEMYIQCQKKFEKLGILPWIAHTELGLAMIDLEQEKYSFVDEHLDKAEKIYMKHCHTWGKIHTNLIRLQTDFYKTGHITENIYDDLYHMCKKYSYNYVLDILNKLKHDECPTNSLMFL